MQRGGPGPTSPLAEEVRERLSGSRLEHLRIVHDDYDEKAFGDTTVVFQADGVLLRFVRDRGLVTVDVGAGNRFLSLDFLACLQDWADLGTIANHYRQPSESPEMRPRLPSDEKEDVYANLLGALAASDEAAVERLAAQLEAAPGPTLSSASSDAPRGPYYGVSVTGSERGAPGDALRTLSDHWREIAAAVADEQFFGHACDEEPGFWRAIRQPTSSSAATVAGSLTAS